MMMTMKMMMVMIIIIIIIIIIMMMIMIMIIIVILIVLINYANKNNDIFKRPLAIFIIDHHIGVSISLVPIPFLQ